MLGGRLPRHVDWVRHDLIDAGWRGRGLVRVTVQLLPVAVVLGVLPGPVFLHWVLPAFVFVNGWFVAGAYGEVLRDRRLRQHGLPVPDEDRG